MRCVVVVAVVLVALAGVAEAQDIDPLDRFQLFNHCQPIGLEVQVTGSAPGLDQASVQALFESRLRGTRLYNSAYSEDQIDPFLRVVLLFDDADNLIFAEIAFRKMLSDSKSGTAAVTSSWARNLFGGTAALTLTQLPSMADRFLVDYLRVNESAC